MSRLRAGRESMAWTVVMIALALTAGAGCAADTTSSADRPGASVDPNTLPAMTNPGAFGVAGNNAGITNPVPTGGTGSSMAAGPSSPLPGITHSIGNTPLPCNVGKSVASACQMCHGAAPIGGAPMSLLTYEDFQADHIVQSYAPLKGQTKKVYELAKIRINDHMSPMPPGNAITPDDFSVLDTWLGQGAPAGTTTDACGMPVVPAQPDPDEGSYGPLSERPGETCYELEVHGALDSVDDSKFMVPPGEEYVQFYYDVPWDTGALGTRYGTRFDNQAVLHHWLLFTTSTPNNAGFSEVVPLPSLVGDNATMLAGWAVGGTNLVLPADAGFELPAKGTKLNAQWHFYNSSGVEQGDHSSVQICTVPAGMRAHVASITYAGTEDLGGNKWAGGPGMPPHQTSTFAGTCDPLRTGMSPTEPIHILGFLPHMHKLGVHMDAIVNHKGGNSESIFSKDFDFNHQIHYLQNYDLAPGDTLTSKCTFNNTTDVGVPYGESSDTEMCYNFVMSWPSHALESNVASLVGAVHTCL